MSEDKINVSVEASSANVSQGMGAAAGAVKGAVGQMNEALGTLKGTSASATAELVSDLGQKVPAAANQTVNALQRVGASAGQQRMGLQVLSYQINDVSTQFAMGTNPMMIFAQQGGQVVQALSLMRGSAGGFIGFMAGPWGAVILGAVSILGVLWAAHEKASDAQKDHKDSAEDLVKATNELNDATNQEIRTTQASIQANINQARALRDRATAARQAAVAELQLAQARMASYESMMKNPTDPDSVQGAAIGAVIEGRRIENINGRIASLNASIAKNDQTIRGNRGLQIQQQIREETDASAAATGRYERRVYALTTALQAGRISEANYAAGIREATNQRDAAEDAAKSSGRSGRSGGGRSRSGGGSKDRTSQWEDQLQAARNGHNRLNQENNTFFEFSKQAEATFWQQILQRQDLSRDERVEVEQKYLAAAGVVRKEAFDAQIDQQRDELSQFQNNQERRLEIATSIADQIKAKYGETSTQYQQALTQVESIERQRAEQIKAINTEIGQAQQQATLDEVDSRQQALDLQTQLGVISQAEAIQREIEFENQRYQINLTALQDRLQLMLQDPDRNPVEYQRIKDEILAIEREHNLRVGQMQNQRMVETQQTQLTGIRSLSQSWGQTLAEMFVGMKTFGQGVAALWQGLVGAIVQALTQMIAKWIAQKIAALILDKTISTATASGQITANAGVAASAAWASTAAIPIVGPALAPGAAASAMAGALSFMPMALAGFAAESGFDVPSGMNPVTQLHQKEMVLPEQYAEVIRAMAEGGGMGGMPAINFYASPGMTQNEMEKHADTLVKILKNAHANREFNL